MKKCDDINKMLENCVVSNRAFSTAVSAVTTSHTVFHGNLWASRRAADIIDLAQKKNTVSACNFVKNRHDNKHIQNHTTPVYNFCRQNNLTKIKIKLYHYYRLKIMRYLKSVITSINVDNSDIPRNNYIVPPYKSWYYVIKFIYLCN